MKNRSNNKTTKNQSLNYQNFFRHTRTPSNKSNNPHHKKHNHFNKSSFQKMLTQTTSSKCKNTQPLSPTKSRSKSRKSKVQSKIIADKLDTKSLRRSRQIKEKMVMIQSLNIAHAQVLSQQEFLRNNSQQLTTNNNMDHSVWMADPLLDIFKRTQKTLALYQNSIQTLKKQKLSAKNELNSAKKRIAQLQRQLLKRKSCQL